MLIIIVIVSVPALLLYGVHHRGRNKEIPRYQTAGMAGCYKEEHHGSAKGDVGQAPVGFIPLETSGVIFESLAVN
jgi:hypothetical protein